MYRALIRFADLEDSRHIYEAGSTFPRPGLTVSPERIEVLSSDKNQAGKPLIAKVVEEAPKEEPKPKKASKPKKKKD